MNLVFFSTAASKQAVGKDVQNRRTAPFSALFKLAILKFQWRKVADFSIIKEVFNSLHRPDEYGSLKYSFIA